MPKNTSLFPTQPTQEEEEPTRPTANQHIPRYCQINNCYNEADYWYPSKNDDTIFVCCDHSPEEESEVGIYSCNPNCPICNN